MRCDLLIKGGTVVDGTGMPRRRADVAIADGRIVRVGRVGDAGTSRVIDAEGLVVAPGFIDPHTHLDPQLCWDPLGTPSVFHGVTTVMTGNCSVTLAPCRAADRPALARLFYMVEEVPLECFEEGIQWTWESFGEFLDALDNGLGINVAALVGHSALRYYVMGPASYERAATDAEISEMQVVLRASMLAGAVGFSTSRLMYHMGEGGRPIPSRLAADREVHALCDVLGELGAGIFETDGGAVLSEFPTHIRELAGPAALRTGCTVLIGGTVQEWSSPQTWRDVYTAIAEFQARARASSPRRRRARSTCSSAWTAPASSPTCRRGTRSCRSTAPSAPRRSTIRRSATPCSSMPWTTRRRPSSPAGGRRCSSRRCSTSATNT